MMGFKNEGAIFSVWPEISDQTNIVVGATERAPLSFDGNKQLFH